MPKSPSAGSPYADTKMLCGLRSRCSTPASCAVCSAPQMRTVDRHRLVDRRAGRLLEPLAVVGVVQLHHDARAAVGGERVVEHRDDVRVVRQLPERVAFPLERAPLGVGGESGVEDLDRHVAVHRALPSPVDDREAAGPDLVEHLVPLDVDREPLVGSAGGHRGVGRWRRLEMRDGRACRRAWLIVTDRRGVVPDATSGRNVPSLEGR